MPMTPGCNADSKIRDPHYKVEQWNEGFGGVIKLIIGTDDLAEATRQYDAAVRKRPRGLYTLRQGTRVIEEHPREE